MITIVYSTHKDENYNLKFRQHLEQTVGLDAVQILEYQNNNEFSLSQVYNRGISEAKYEIIVCCHNDIKLEKNWGVSLLKDFDDNPDYGIIGKAGSTYFPKSGIYWEDMTRTMVGQVFHQPKDSKQWLSKYSRKYPSVVPVATIDGLFISFNKNKIKEYFDETIGKFHFYDHLFCLANLLKNVKIGVTFSFEIIHESVGVPNNEFFETKDKFLKKYGEFLPLKVNPENFHIENIKEKPIKNIGKTAIIILTKSKNSLLFQCINSILEHFNTNLFDIFIADTGSSEDEKAEILQFISGINNIKLINYDYYNFAKINNDVIKNYLNDSYEFILFCNNDIIIKNNVLYGMLKSFKEDKMIGTIGARLHYPDNTIQHNGHIIFKRGNTLHISHYELHHTFNYLISKHSVIGNTAALMMIRKKTFDTIGGFNENYENCFEDVELNLNCILRGMKNYCDSSLVAIHFESQTRKDDLNKTAAEIFEFNTKLMPFILRHIKKFENYIYLSN